MKKFTYLFVVLLILSASCPIFAATTDDFVITIDTTKGDGANSFTIPTYPGEAYNYNVDCNNDGSTEATGVTGDFTCNYSSSGTYSIRIIGKDFPRIYFNNTGDKDKIVGINQWGTVKWKSMEKAFMGCSNLNDTGGAATDNPNLSNVTSMKYMFYRASAFNQDIGNWDVSNVADMSYMFNKASAFNQDITEWNVGNVTDMSYMFSSASEFDQKITKWNVSNVRNMYGMFWNAAKFNQDIGSWDVSNVTDMSYMFSGASKFDQNIGNWDVINVTSMREMFSRATDFNQNIGNWNVSNVTDMHGMFSGASKFDQNIGNWNVSNVTDMSIMFWEAILFNQDISNWNVSNVTNMTSMFSHASDFNQDLSKWNVESVTNFNYMFSTITLSTKNYDALLKSWSKQNLHSSMNFSGGNSKYCAVSAHNKLTSPDGFNWTITDGGLDTNCPKDITPVYQLLLEN